MAKLKQPKKSAKKQSDDKSRNTFGPGKSFGRGNAPAADRRRRGF